MIRFFESAGRFSLFTWQALLESLRSFAHPREVGRQFTRQLLGSLPLALLAGLAIGIVVWMHLRGVLIRMGGPSAAELLPGALALAVALEFGPIAAGLIAAGREGANLGAELGAMKLGEQVDALELLGRSPVKYLVGPRVLALVLLLPLLTVFVDVAALAGSFFAEASTSNTSWLHYRTSFLKGLRLEDVVPATAKTLTFGFVIAVAGCYQGLRAEGGTEGVGRAATRGVVASIVGVLIADVLLVRLIQFMGGG